MILDDIKNRTTGLLGFGVEGQSTYRFLRSRFPKKPIIITDKQPLDKLEVSPDVLNLLKGDDGARFYCGDDHTKALEKCEVIIKSPGIPCKHPLIHLAEMRGALITSQTEIFFEIFDRKRIIGITGTKGKSTTTTLIHKIMINAGMDTRLAGNIGAPPLSEIDNASPNSLFVLELSSYQLEQLKRSPHIAILLNIVPEHLDYHMDFSAYVAAKENITKFQAEEDFLIFNYDYPLPKEISSRTRATSIPFSMGTKVRPGCFITGEMIKFSDGREEREILAVTDIPLRGEFNRQNVLAAVTVATILGIPSETIRGAVREYKALPHRLEVVGEYNGILFYDDSISTVPECTLGALSALGPDVQTLILGGHERHLDYEDLAWGLLDSRVENIILFPPTGARIWMAIRDAAGANINRFKSFPVETMEQAVRLAFVNTEPGRICLLSPASPSYSGFKDYRARGNAFKNCIREHSHTLELK